MSVTAVLLWLALARYFGEVRRSAEMLAQFNDVRTAQRQHVVLLVQDHKGLRWIPLYVGAK